MAALTACTADPAVSGRTSDAEPRSGGSLVLALGSDPKCLDPHQVGNSDGLSTARQLVDSLTGQDPKTGKTLPWLATSWEVRPDARQFTFHLRSDATFSDGKPVDAQAVRANFDDVVKLGAKAILGNNYLAGYRRTTVVDQHTARVEFDRPNAQFLHATSTTTLGLLAPSGLARDQGRRCAAVVGSGPFTLGRFTPDQEVVLKKRAGYAWGSAAWTAKGAARLDQVTLKIVPEQGVRSGSLTSGQVDGTFGVSAQEETALKQSGFTVLSRSNPGIVYSFGVNVSRPFTKDVAVRRALQKIIDRREVVDTVLSPSFKPARSILAGSTADFTDLSVDLATDLPGARKLLDGAGWRAGDDGIRTKNGKRLSLKANFFTGFAPGRTALELIQQQFKKAGVELKLKEYGIGQGQQAYRSGDYDLSWSNATSPDPDILRAYYSPKALNAVRVTGGPLPGLLDAQAVQGDPKLRTGQIAQTQQIIVRDAYSLPVFEYATVVGLAPHVHGLRLDAAAQLLLHDAWVAK
ncbi:ABC transporter substrate-binding protein [Streptomyces sp. NPDC048428]|uniref:ABC transporter substrate-binding protein n=1 Tax=Streptomyces sp. NPDC048428 TaxID=3154503 RepID=UPI00342D6F7C